MGYEQILVNRKDRITWLTLNRPEKLNALTPIMISELLEILKSEAKEGKSGVIIVNGAGRSWSAGVDLSIFQDVEIGPGNPMWENGMEIMHLLETMPQVTIAMVNGFCFTGALELLMAFDLIYTADEAKFGDTHAKWGLPPKWGMTQRLQRQIGLRKAKELSFTTIPVNGIEAERLGLANKSVPLPLLKETVEKLALQILSNSAQVIASMKKLYHFGNMHTIKEGMQYETDYKHQITDKTEELKNFKKKL